MNRRKFIRNSSFATLSVSALAATGCNNDSTAGTSEKAENAAFKDDFELNEITIDGLQQQMQAGTTSSEKITQLYLKRIEAIDKNGPAINAVIEVNPDAISIAKQMDEERKAGKVRGPLHGIPVLIKDNIDTADKMMTTAGALALAGNIASKDAFVAVQLRKAGAVILGKTNLSEWANFRSLRSCSGWSGRGGQTKNPCILDRNPSGSSSGSGAAVAANLCAVAVGTETDGSVISPASHCGIVGIKPTIGLVSRSGIIPISSTQDTAGPMTRTVKDAAILLGVMAGADPDDVTTVEFKSKAIVDYTKLLDEKALSGKTIGIEKANLNGHEAVVALYKQAIEVLKQQGATVVELEVQKAFEGLGDAEWEVLQYEFKDGVNKYLANANASVKTLADVIAFNKANEAKTMPWFKQEILELCEKKGDLNSKEYTDAVQKSKSAAGIIDKLLTDNKLDAICAVSTGMAGCTDLINGDYSTGFYSCPPAAMAGYPHITVPMGDIHELPVGFSFFGTAWDEPRLLALAYSFEQATKKRKAPKFLPTFGA